MPPPDLSHRAALEDAPELMDDPSSYEQLRACLHSIARLNRITHAYRPTLQFLTRATQSTLPSDPPLRIVDLGCGYGDTLRRIERWAAARHLTVHLLGVDLNPHATRAAAEASSPASRIRWVAGDATLIPEAQDADLILSSLVMHHIPEPGIVHLLRWMDRTARRGWFLCDLHRMPTPYRLFSALMHGPWWHPFIRADGLASIRRGFREQDWLRIADSAGLRNSIQLRRQAPARLCIEHLRPAPADYA